VFKNATIYRIAAGYVPDGTAAVAAINASPFTECGPAQEYSSGWVPPRGEAHGALIESVDGSIVLRLRTETKKVPGPLLARRVKERAADIERLRGRKPGKKETREIKDNVRLELLPHAFPAQADTWVWINLAEGLVVIDTASQTRADDISSLLVECFAGMSLSLLNTERSPAGGMGDWLSTNEAPAGFTVDRECYLQAQDESKAAVRYLRHALNTQEVQDHVRAGMMPVKLAMTWNDRVSFALNASGQLTGIKFLDIVFDGTDADDPGFDADVAILSGELRGLVPAVIEALGGEVQS